MSINGVKEYGGVAYADVVDLHDGDVVAVKLKTAVAMGEVLGERAG